MTLPPTLRQLKILDAIGTTGSVTDAAKLVLIGQPAVSKSLAALEVYVGFEIFERIGNRISFTEKGRGLYSETQRLLGVVEDFDGIVEDIRLRGAQRIRVATIQTISGSEFLANAMSVFCKQNSHVRLQIDAMTRQEIVRAVTSESTDLAIGYLPVSSKKVKVTSFGRSKLYAVAREGTWLKSIEIVSPNDLARLPMLLLFDRSRLRRTIEGFMYTAGENFSIRAEVASGAAITRMAQAGVGVGISDELSLTNIGADGLDVRPLSRDLSLEVGFVHRENGKVSKYQRDLEAAIRKSWAQLMPREGATHPGQHICVL